MANPIGLQCQKCRYTLCRECINGRQPSSYTGPVDVTEPVLAVCAQPACDRRVLGTPVLPTGRHDVTPMDPETIEGVVVARDGAIAPTPGEALVVVTRFLPFLPEDAPLLHIRRSSPGAMSDGSTRDRLALSLVLGLEREGALAPGAWARSRRMFIKAGAARDTDYLITVVHRRHLSAVPAAAPGGAWPGTYTYLLQILAANGGWALLRDPRTGAFADGAFGAVTAPAGMLPDIAHEVIQRFSAVPYRRRVVFFEGDRTQQRLTTDDAYGVVMEGGTSLLPYSGDSG
ncbi:hypothetical protein ACFVWY_11120 [Streptomyces sp. NPDC058195]|uniref:hypothetical protein n=1 Tax=Streptomyces sp. NPDC058195 TaxID=3346375 RepID=UPI0036E50F2C